MGIIYTIVLIIFTKSSDTHDHFIYPMFKLKTVGSWLALFFNLLFAILVHFIVYGFSKCKN